jgi:hypothetical protein
MTRRPDNEMLLELVPKDGSSIGNVTLIGELGWAQEKYWRVRERLLESGHLERGKGKGGSVRRSNQNGPYIPSENVSQSPRS